MDSKCPTVCVELALDVISDYTHNAVTGEMAIHQILTLRLGDFGNVQPSLIGAFTDWRNSLRLAGVSAPVAVDPARGP